MAAKPLRRRLKGWELLGLLLYGNYTFKRWLSPTKIRVASGQFAKHMQVSSSRFREYLHWLVEMGFAVDVETDHGFAIITMVIPKSDVHL